MFEKITSVLRYFWIKWSRPGKLISYGLHGIGCGSLFKLKGKMSVGERTSFGRFNYIDIKGDLKIGHRCHMNDYVRIVCHQQISIGNHVIVAAGVSIYDHDHKATMVAQELVFDGYISEPIHIGNHVWIGEKAIILKGVTVGDNVIIGAGSVIISDIPSNTVAVGNPCKVVKYLVQPE